MEPSESMTSKRYVESNFKDKKKIGSGAFGSVYLVTLADTGEKVAVKVVFQDMRYKNRELSMMKEMNHPNNIKLLNYFYTNEDHKGKQGKYLNCVMEYVPDTLSVLLSHNRRNNKTFAPLFMKLMAFQMLKSIGYLASLGICHR